MESGGFVESNTVTDSVKTKRILLFNKKIYVWRDERLKMKYWYCVNAP